MTTIDKLDIGIYIQYARRTQMIEQINLQYRLEEAPSIPPQTSVLTLYPQLTELDILLGVIPVTTPWAYFFPPKRFSTQRRSPFTFSRIAPSVSPIESAENDTAFLDKVECHEPDEQKEKEAIKSCLGQIKKINSWLSFVIGRMGQFLQG